MPAGRSATREIGPPFERTREGNSEARMLTVQERGMRAGARDYGLQNTFELIASELNELVSHDYAALLSWRDVYRNLRVEATAGSRPHGLEPDMQLPMSATAVELAGGRLEAAICADTRVSSDWIERRLAEGGMLSCITLPLQTEGTHRKLMVVASRRTNQYSHDDAVRLGGLGEAIRASLHGYWEVAKKPGPERYRGEDGSVQEHYRLVAEVSNGVVHSLNNVFASLLGNLQLLGEEIDNQEMARRLKEMEEAVIRGTGVLRSLAQFSGKGRGQGRETLDLKELVQEVIDLTRPVWRQGRGSGRIEVKHQGQAGISIHAHRGEIKEALINIIFNAIQALPEGGEIVVTEGYDGDEAFVQVADNGVGMDQETWRRAKTPFFTTRGNDSDGLGLSVVSGIARKHGGEISIASEPGEGTVVRMSVELLGRSN